MKRIGDIFYEYNKQLNTVYPRRIHSQIHLDYYKSGRGVRAFDSLEEAELFIRNEQNSIKSHEVRA